MAYLFRKKINSEDSEVCGSLDGAILLTKFIFLNDS